MTRLFDIRRRAISLLFAVALAQSLEAVSEEVHINRISATVQAVEKIMPSVVNIATATIIERRDPYESFWRNFFGYRTSRPEAHYSRGSGVFIDDTGFVLTNDHVVRGATKVWITTHNSDEPLEAEVVDLKRESDLALLKVKSATDKQFKAAEFADEDDLILGETVLALGNPFGLGGSVSRGILSSKSRRPAPINEMMDVEDWLQTDAAINPGNSGGPLINLNGEIIGINVAVLQEGQGIGFAIPNKIVTKSLSEIFTPEIDGLWFGAKVTTVARPLVIKSVQLDSPAFNSGLKPGDIVISVNGRSPKNFIEFNRDLLASGEFDTAEIVIKRKSKNINILVRLIPEAAFFNSSLVLKRTGMSTREISREAARRLAISANRGLLIDEIEEQSPAAKAGLKGGYILTSADGEGTESIIDLAKILYRKKTGDTVNIQFLVPQINRRFVTLAPYQTNLEIE